MIGWLPSVARGQGLSPEEYEKRKEEVADRLIERLERRWPGMGEATIFRCVAPYNGWGAIPHIFLLQLYNMSIHMLASSRGVCMVQSPFTVAVLLTFWFIIRSHRIRSM